MGNLFVCVSFHMHPGLVAGDIYVLALARPALIFDVFHVGASLDEEGAR